MSIRYNTVEVNGIKVPATFHDALLKIKDGLQRDRVNFASVGRYEFYDPGTDKMAYCPIGYLFTAAQRAAIGEIQEPLEAMGLDVDDLAALFGEKNLITVMGMKLRDGLEIQQLFDNIAMHPSDYGNQRDAFKELLADMLARPNYDNPGLKYIS